MSNNDRTYWDERYSIRDRIWSGRPGDELVRIVSPLSPGRALDLGCGEGADAIWLAGRGWQVTAVDISEVALSRARENAVRADVADRIDFRCADLGESFPEGKFDLVSAQYLHSRTGNLPREAILRMAAAAVAPGGVLLIVGHSEQPPTLAEPSQSHGHHGCEGPHGASDEINLPKPGEVLRALNLPAGEWHIVQADEHVGAKIAPDGESYTRADNTVLVRRLPAGSAR